MSFVKDVIAKYSVGGDADIAICVLPNATVLVATRTAMPLRDAPKPIQEKLFRTASDIATLAYDAMQASGTNIIALDHDHAHYLVIARNEEDGIPLRWNPGKSSPQELATLASKLKESAWTIGKRDVTDVQRPVLEETKPAPLKPSVQVPHQIASKTPEHKDREIQSADMHSPHDTSGHDLADVADEIQRPVRKGPFGETDYRIKNLTRRR